MADNDAGCVEVQLTDVGNAKRLVFRIKEDFRFCPDGIGNRWLRWDGKRWEPDALGTIMEEAKETTKAMLLDAAERDNKKLVLHALQSQRVDRLRAMVTLAQSETGIPVRQADLDSHPWLLNVLNGTLDLRTGELRKHERTNLITKLAPVTYDPTATCPQFEDFLLTIYAKNIEMVRFIQRAAGYSLTGVTTERMLFLLWGTGANGKTTLLNILCALLGDYAMVTPTETLIMKRETGIPNDIARLKGARLVTADESEKGKRLAEARIKQMTGNANAIPARFMRSEFFQFRPEFKIWLGTNHKPDVRGTDDAIWDRIKLIAHTVRIPDEKQVTDFDKVLLATELPGILRWAVEGCLAWQRDGLRVPKEVRDSTADYRRESDIVGQFIAECCHVGPASYASVTRMFATYGKWCEESRERPLTQREFGTALRERGYETDHTRTGSRWLGIGLSDGPCDARDGRDGDCHFFSNARVYGENRESASRASRASQRHDDDDREPGEEG
jgi:putative DNA primase/helicase